MSDDKTCEQCGAPTSDLLCEFCGTLSGAVRDAETESAALRKFHQLLQNSDKDRQGHLLKTGFLPHRKKLLIEAGLHCMPLADTDDTTSAASIAAVQRLETVITKLRLMPPDDEITRAIKEFRSKISRFKKADRFVLIIGLVLIGGIIGGSIYGIAHCAC